MNKLSIIVPVYNVDKYLSNCLSSIAKQDLLNYEVIIVNDGSTDNSGLIAKEFCDRFNNFYLYTKENGGLSSARNFGLDKSSGEYVYFLDSDDYLEANSLRRVMDEVKKYKLDGIAFDFRKVSEKGEVISKKNYYNDIGIVTGNEFLNKFTCISNVWSYLYRKDILIENKLSFFEGIYHEDELFTPQAISYCQKFKYLDLIVYNYLQRSNSIMTNVSIENKMRKFNSKIIVLSELLNFSQKEKLRYSLDYHPVDRKIEDIAISLAIQSLRQDGIDKLYKKQNFIRVLPKEFKVRYASIKKKIFWLFYSYFN